MSVLVYTESDNGSFKKGALEVASYAKAVANQLGTTVTAVSINVGDASQLGTYGVGKVANAWLKAGRPEDLAQFKDVYEEARTEGMKNFKDFINMGSKDKPLGDESKKFNLKREVLPFYEKLKFNADKVASKIEKTISDPFK